MILVLSHQSGGPVLPDRIAFSIAICPLRGFT